MSRQVCLYGIASAAWCAINKNSGLRIAVRLSASAAGLTSLKRFQCFILRLYCEMVDSHCSSSMKFPVFSASLTVFKSVWKAESASITSGIRRHAISVIPTMAAVRKIPLTQAAAACFFLFCAGEDARAVFGSTKWLAWEREREGERRAGGGARRGKC